jgi:hypothetical protein
MIVTVKNNSAAPQGVHTEKGVQFVAPGASRELSLNDEQLFRVKALPFLAYEEIAEQPEPDQFDAMTDDELRAHLTERDGKAPHPNAKRETLLAKARETA